MNKLELTTDDEIVLLSKYKMSPNELMLMQTLLILQDESNEELFKSYIELLYECKIQLRDVLYSLQDKGIILKSFKIPKSGERFDPYSIPINKNFIKNFYRSSFDMGKELFEAYPQFGHVNGNVVGLRSVSKRFDSLEDAYFKYGKSIKWNPEIHKHILELLEWSKENEIINYTLTSFIIDRRWEELEALRDGKIANIDFDSIKVV